MIGRPGSIVWLLHHELRLDWRRRMEAQGLRRWLAILLGIGVPLTFGVLVGAPLGLLLRDTPEPFSPQTRLVLAAALISSFMMMLSQSLSAVVEALYARSDLELLFSSPIKPLRVVAVRALAIAFAPFSVFGFFAIGPLVVVALYGQPGWLAALPVLYGMALAATGLALMIGLALIRAVGARRTRVTGQALSVLFGSMFFLATQGFTLTGPGGGWTTPMLAKSTGLSGLPSVDWACRALRGEPLAFAALMSLQLGVFITGLATAGPRFSALYAAAAGAPANPGAPGPVRRFGRGAFIASLRKELRLLRRDPMLLPVILLRLAYLVPLGLLALHSGASAEVTGLPGAIMALTLMSHQLAGSLTWLTIAAEDAPELLASSPAPAKSLVCAKVGAVAVTMTLIFAPVVMALLFVAPQQALAGILGVAAATLSAALVNIWWQTPARRTALRQRARASWFVTLAELGLGMLIAVAAGLFAAGQPAGLAPALAAMATLLVLRGSAPRPRAPK